MPSLTAKQASELTTKGYKAEQNNNASLFWQQMINPRIEHAASKGLSQTDYTVCSQDLRRFNIKSQEFIVEYGDKLGFNVQISNCTNEYVIHVSW